MHNGLSRRNAHWAHTWVTGVLVLLVVFAVSAQSPAPRNGVIAGQVVDAISGKPVSAAVVVISGDPFGGPTGPSAATPTRLLTGSDGRFVFARLPVGSFTITATKGGYAEGASGRRRPGGSAQLVALADSQRSAEIAVRL